jgi:hypothetical protein
MFLIADSYVVDNIGSMAELKKEAILLMAGAKEKQLFKKGAERDERGLSDWIRWLARRRLRELGLLTDPDVEKPKKKL